MSEYKRLTARNKNNLAYLINVKPDEQEVNSPYKNTLRCILDSFQRLAQFEDIDLSPERIKQILDSRPLYRLEKGQVIVDEDAFNYCNELATAYSKIGTVEEFAELAKAKTDERLAILSTPKIPLVESDDPMDTDVYCPACGESLSGGWPEYHTDQGWAMCQCFYCGQSIDDTKVITRAEAESALKQIGGSQDD